MPRWPSIVATSILVTSGLAIALAAAVAPDAPTPASAQAHATRALRTETTAPAPPASTSAVVAKPVSVPAPIATPEPLVVRRILDLGGAIKFGDFAWDDKGVPPGPLVITVDLAAQTLSVFRGGYEIGAAAILYGADNKPTPLGVFPITQKDADHVSNLYDAPMPYMLRLTDDGVSIHGTEVQWGYATHGCVGVPTAFARHLFSAAKLGDKVIITNGKTMDIGQAITS